MGDDAVQHVYAAAARAVAALARKPDAETAAANAAAAATRRLPARRARAQLLRQVAANRVCLLCGETREVARALKVPQMIHDALRDGELHAGSRARFVLCSQPRRLAVVRAPLQCLAARRCHPAAAACASAAQSGLGGP